MGLSSAGETMAIEPLTGGVASDIWRVDLADRSICVKRARPVLKVQQEWHVPVERNAFEVAWLRTAASIVPDAIPKVLGHIPDRGLFAMEYLAPDHCPIWKATLRKGIVDMEFAAEVALRLAKVHATTAHDDAVAKAFATDALFLSLRVEPYLLTTAKRHRDVAARIKTLADQLTENKSALVHGDVSPKNILASEKGPVFLDAECAWYGDPAFDLSFCLNHLLLKCLWNPAAKEEYVECFDHIASTYLGQVSWEPPGQLEQRSAALLPALMLARVDGKSPVEYIESEIDKVLVRDFAKRFLNGPTDRLRDVSRAWTVELDAERSIS